MVCVIQALMNEIWMNEKNQASTITSGKYWLFPIMCYVNVHVFSKTRSVLFRGPVRLLNKHSFILVTGLQSTTSQSNISQQLCKVAFHLKYEVLSESYFKWRICVLPLSLQSYHHLFFSFSSPSSSSSLFSFFFLFDLKFYSLPLYSVTNIYWLYVCAIVPLTYYVSFHLNTVSQMNISLRPSAG